jgi:hypothetical protein
MQPVTWTTLEFEKKDRHPDWLWYAGLVAVIASVLSFFFSNFFFGIFCLIAGATVIIYALRDPKMLVITLEPENIRINEEIIPHAKIKQFWLDETTKPDKLLLHTIGSFVPLLSLHLEGISAETVRETLKAQGLPEVQMRESTSVKIFDRLGF